MSASIDQLVGMGLGVVAWCYNRTCRRPSAYIPAGRLAAFAGRDLTCEAASRLMCCAACGAHGRDGRFEILPSTMDIEDIRHERPAGYSEGVRAEKLARGTPT